MPEDDSVSILEAEYDAATEVALPRLVYLIHETTPWILAHVDSGESAERLLAFKKKLQSQHMCTFFSSPDGLAASVAADLGRYFASKQPTHLHRRPIDPQREQRLIAELRSSDFFRVRRSIEALTRSQSPWLVDALGVFVVGDDEVLAHAAIQALAEISGISSAEAIAAGLGSKFLRIRSWAAYFLGEIALRGRVTDARTFIQRLVKHLDAPGEFADVLDEVVHSIAKIGGRKAFAALVELLESDGVPGFLKAKALHGPGEFWRHAGYGSGQDPKLHLEFVATARGIISTWPERWCREVQNTKIFKYIEKELCDTVDERISITVQKIRKETSKAGAAEPSEGSPMKPKRQRNHRRLQ